MWCHDGEVEREDWGSPPQLGVLGHCHIQLQPTIHEGVSIKHRLYSNTYFNYVYNSIKCIMWSNVVHPITYIHNLSRLNKLSCTHKYPASQHTLLAYISQGLPRTFLVNPIS